MAKLIVKSNPFVTEKEDGEIIVTQNKAYQGSEAGSKDDFGTMKAFAAAIVALLCYLVFELLLQVKK